MDDSTLDFTSPLFDSLKALYTDDLRPPMPIKALDNLAAYESVMMGKKRSGKDKECDSEENELKSSESGQRQTRTRVSDGGKASKIDKPQASTSLNYKTRTLLHKMKEREEGPMKLLQNCCKHGHLVRVWIRRAVGLRGHLVGRVIAYDKHMNLAMRNVHEDWVVNPKQTYISKVAQPTDSCKQVDINSKDSKLQNVETSECGRAESERLGVEVVMATAGLETDVCVASEQMAKKRKRRKKKCGDAQPVVSERFVKQLFVRGDNIVMISPYKKTKSER